MKTKEQASGSDRIPAKSKILYGLGDLYGGGGFQLVGFFYAIFLSDTLGLGMAYIPIVLAVGKVWDAISDPLMGRITDNAKSRWGRRRPFFLFGSAAVALSFLFLFAPFASGSQAALLAFAIVSYLTFCTVWTVVMVPYFAFGAEMTLDYNERTRLVTVRMLFSLVGSLLASALPMTIVNSFGTSRQGYFAMAVLFGVVFGLAVLSVFFSRRETPRPNLNQDKVGFFRAFVNSLKIRAFRLYVGMFIFGMLAIDIVSMIMAYYTRYYLRADGVLTLFLTLALVTQLAVLPFWSFIARKFSKRAAYMAGAVVWMAMGVVIFFIQPSIPIAVILTFVVINSVGMGAVMFIPHTILGDITDIGEFAYGKREEGTFSGFATFIRKLSSGLGLAAVTGVLGILGYVTPPPDTVNFTLIAQPPEVEAAIRIFISAVPAALALIGFLFASRYRVSRDCHKKVVEHMNSLREGGPGTLDREEELALRRLLISKRAK
jgi:oligogalacturonide transporter